MYQYTQGRIQDFAQGWGQIGHQAPEKFFVPPPELLRGGGQGRDRIQEEGENQVTYQSIGIGMF